MRLLRRTVFFCSRRKGALFSRFILLAVVPVVWAATASLATAQPNPSHGEAPATYHSGETLTFLAPAIFSDEDLGRGYPAQLYPLDGTRIVDGTVCSIRVDSMGTWLRRRTNGVGLNVSGTATGMTESTLSPSGPEKRSTFNLPTFNVQIHSSLVRADPHETPSLVADVTRPAHPPRRRAA